MKMHLSSEHWQLVAMPGNKVRAIFPGCAVKAVMVADKKPDNNDCYEFS